MQNFNNYKYGYNSYYTSPPQQIYYSIVNDTSVYSKMAYKFLEDKDAPEGKALHYYLAMKD